MRPRSCRLLAGRTAWLPCHAHPSASGIQGCKRRRRLQDFPAVSAEGVFRALMPSMQRNLVARAHYTAPLAAPIFNPASRRPGLRYPKGQEPCKGATRRGDRFVAPLQGLDGGAPAYPGRRCALPWAFLFAHLRCSAESMAPGQKSSRSHLQKRRSPIRRRFLFFFLLDHRAWKKRKRRQNDALQGAARRPVNAAS